MDILMIILLVLFGFIVGVLASWFGLGGAVITIPFFRIVLGLSGHEAIATALPLTIPTAISGTYAYQKKKLVKYKTAISIGIIGSFFSVFGAYFTIYFSSEALMVMTALLFIILSIVILKQKIVESKPKKFKLFEAAWRAFLIGSVAGLISGFFGIGGGAILVPLLVVVAKLPMKVAIPTSLLAIAIYAIPGSLTHYALGNIQVDVLAFVLVGSVVGAYVGAGWMMKFKESTLRKMFAAFLLLMAASLLVNEFLLSTTV